ncbi:MAG: LysR family transcriptional regulator [Proteobacteria bacterium]|nr:LysR family transcriptional regulator [Pseudomonadota bacterium]
MHNLEIKHLRMLRAITESGNMTRAAEKLSITQSALSQQLKDIEGKLGADLFFRTRKKMIVTEVGKQLLETATQVIEALDLAEQDISRKISGELGELKVGTQCIFCYKWLPKVMHLFQRKFPSVEIEVGNSVDLQRELEDKKYDLIISGVGALGNTHTSVPLFQDQLVCIMWADHPLSDCSFVQFEDFRGNNLISHAEKGTNRFYQQVLKAKGIEPRKIMNVGAPQAIIEMVAAGFGISVFPRWAIAEALKTWAIVARPITPRGLPLIWHAVYLTHDNIPIYQQEFIRSISKLNVTEQTMLTGRRMGMGPSVKRAILNK